MPEISLIIPALNEGKNIPQLIERLEALFQRDRLDAEILIIDDHSEDNTFAVSLELAKKFPNVRPLRKPLPRGIGNAIRFGIQNARGMAACVVMADGVDPIDAIRIFRDKIINEGYELALLSRYANPEDSGGIPFRYRICHIGYRFFMGALLGIRFKDTTYAYRAFNLDFIRALGLKSGGFEISSEITIKTCLKKGRVYEVKGRQGRRLYGASKFRFLKHGPGYTKVLIEGFIARITGKWI